MPFYDFRCKECGSQFALFYPSFAAYEESKGHSCTTCNSLNTVRKIGRVALTKGEDSRMDAMAEDALLAGVDENDPKSIGRFMKQMSSEMGETMGDEFNEVVERLEKGQSPDDIEKSMPGLSENLDQDD